MSPTILIVGATGNTGRSVVETLPELLKNNSSLAQHRILALTRDKESSAAQKLATVPGVEVAEQHWNEITAEWLSKHEVERVFIAAHNGPSAFAEEGQFHVEAKRAGVKYVVRISTTAANMKPDCPAYYPRTHWAIEQMLSQPEFEAMHWSSLQPNVFFNFVLGPAADIIRQHRQTGKLGHLSLMLDADTPTGVIDPWDVGIVAAHLLAAEHTSQHNHARYVLNGPSDITGSQVVGMVEEQIGTKIEDVRFKDVSFIDQWADSVTDGSKNLIRTVKNAPRTAWSGEATASTTSKEILALAPPKRIVEQALAELLQ
ncbi:hypothetical protein Q7P37_006915 [Cladosporium fusiforme]